MGTIPTVSVQQCQALVMLVGPGMVPGTRRACGEGGGGRVLG